MPELTKLTDEEKRLEQHAKRLRTRNFVCVTCGKPFYPGALQYSHIIPRAMHDDGGAQCSECHSKFSDRERMFAYSPQTKNPQMEIIGRYLLALADWLRQIVETIAAFGAWLLGQAEHVLPYEPEPTA